MFWDLYQSWQIAETSTTASIAERTARDARTNVDGLQRRVKRLEVQVERLTLGSMALAELLRDRLGVPQAEIDAKVQEIDLRDGSLDGKLTREPPVCPGCHRTNSAQRRMCLYCGKPLPAGTNLLGG
jgi:hypothetical protein